MTQKNEIEMYAKANERPEDFLKDIKDLTNNPFSKINQQPESERERERHKRKQNNLKKLEKTFKEEEYKWEKHEEAMEKERLRLKHHEEDMLKKRKRLLEKDLNYDSNEEKKKIKSNPKFYEEYKQMRIKEREFDEMMRKKENTKQDSFSHNVNNETQTPKNDHNQEANNTSNPCLVTDLALKEDLNQERRKAELIPKSEVVVIELNEDEEDNEHNHLDHDHEHKNTNGESTLENHQGNKKDKLILNINKNMKKGKYALDDYEDENDLYHKKNVSHQIQIDEETEKIIMEISQEVNNERKEEERRQMQKQTLTTITTDPADSKQKLIELQKQVFELIPKEKETLFKFPINWKIVISVIINYRTLKIFSCSLINSFNEKKLKKFILLILFSYSKIFLIPS